MAGQGSRFAQAGYDKPKPFIDVNGKPMIFRVLENLDCPDASYILIAREEHLEAEPDLVHEISHRFNVTWITVDQLTEGTASTVLFAREEISNDLPLIIANSDQIIDGGIQPFLEDAQARRLDGSILCFQDLHRDPKWSFAKTNLEGYVTEVKEKEAISDLATVGIYYFTNGYSFVDSAVEMIIRNDRVNGEFYTCPTYNYLIKRGKKVGVYLIDANRMNGIGTPADLNAYISTCE